MSLIHFILGTAVVQAIHPDIHHPGIRTHPFELRTTARLPCITSHIVAGAAHMNQHFRMRRQVSRTRMDRHTPVAADTHCNKKRFIPCSPTPNQKFHARDYPYPTRISARILCTRHTQNPLVHAVWARSAGSACRTGTGHLGLAGRQTTWTALISHSLKAGP